MPFVARWLHMLRYPGRSGDMFAKMARCCRPRLGRGSSRGCPAFAGPAQAPRITHREPRPERLVGGEAMPSCRCPSSRWLWPRSSERGGSPTGGCSSGGSLRSRAWWQFSQCWRGPGIRCMSHQSLSHWPSERQVPRCPRFDARSLDAADRWVVSARNGSPGQGSQGTMGSVLGQTDYESCGLFCVDRPI